MKIRKMEEILNIRTEKQGKVNGVNRYKVWRLKNGSVFIFEGSYTLSELEKEAKKEKNNA